MNINLIQGKFQASDAVDIITKMIQVKINYHEQHIKTSSNEEDISFRESKITHLQNELSKIRNHISDKGEMVSVKSTVEIE